jgi:uncharacterized protein with PQ loop repeat
MDLGAIAGWASVVLGQLVSWPQVLKLRRERGDGVSLASYAIVNVSMTLFSSTPSRSATSFRWRPCLSRWSRTS